jgi:hypothetical protein
MFERTSSDCEGVYSKNMNTPPSFTRRSMEMGLKSCVCTFVISWESVSRRRSWRRWPKKYRKLEFMDVSIRRARKGAND